MSTEVILVNNTGERYLGSPSGRLDVSDKSITVKVQDRKGTFGKIIGFTQIAQGYMNLVNVQGRDYVRIFVQDSKGNKYPGTKSCKFHAGDALDLAAMKSITVKVRFSYKDMMPFLEFYSCRPA